MQETATKLLENKLPTLVSRFSGEIEDATEFREQLCLTVKRSAIKTILTFLKREPEYQFSMLMDLFGMDYLKLEPPTPERFCVIYILYSLKSHQHLRIKVYLNEDDLTIDSIHDLYRAANWYEREAWDLFGIHFSDHPNLTRILCHQDFEGHPLRKDYPSDGYQRLKQPIEASRI